MRKIQVITLFPEMFDCVAGMDDVEACGFKGDVFDAPDMQFDALEAGAGPRHALVGLDRDEVGRGRFIQQSAREAAAIGTNIEKRERACRTAMAQHGINRDLGAEALAVTNIAPIGAARHGRRRARRSVGARQALHQSAMRANVYGDAPLRALRRVCGLERVAAAQFAKLGLVKPSGRTR